MGRLGKYSFKYFSCVANDNPQVFRERLAVIHENPRSYGREQDSVCTAVK